MDVHVAALGLLGPDSAAGKWVALRLSDGGSDGVLYPTREDAMRHQLHVQWCAYLLIPPTGTTPHSLERFLVWVGGLYEQGMQPKQNHDRMPALLVPNRLEDFRR